MLNNICSCSRDRQSVTRRILAQGEELPYRVAIVLLPGMDGTGKLFADFSAALEEQVRPVIVPYPED